MSTSSLDGQGKNDHQQHSGSVFDFSNPEASSGWGDIIPSSAGVSALNDDEAGLAILANGCNGPQQGSCPDGSQPVEGSCPTEETCPSGEPAEGGECPDEALPCDLDPELSADDPGCTGPEVCPFDETLAADDAECVEAEVTPDEPETPVDLRKPIEVLPSVTSGVAADSTPVEAAAPTLPVTGSNTGTLALLGSALVGLGSALMVAQRRRGRLG